MGRKWVFLLALAGFFLAVASALSGASSGLGYRTGLWHFRTGFAILRWAAIGGIFSAALSLAGLVSGVRARRPKAVFYAALGVLIGAAVFYIPLSFYQRAGTVPPIHDITTDTEDPPAFVAILPLRKDAPNPAEYDPQAGRLQEDAYPEIKPLSVSLEPAEVFDIAVSVAMEMGWEVVDASREEGRIEATDTTFWYGFKDDIVLRIRPGDSGSILDARSVSRVGVSDVGTNARRIDKYFRLLKKYSKE